MKTFVPERYAASADDEAIIRRHFDARDASEAAYFAEHDTVRLRAGAQCRSVGAGGCNTPEEVDAMRALGPQARAVLEGVNAEKLIPDLRARRKSDAA